MSQFLIGNILVQIDYAGIPFHSEGNLQRFTHTGNWDGDTVRLNCSIEALTRYRAHQLKRDNHVYGLYSFQNQTCIIYHWGRLLHGFAVWPERFSVTFDPEMLHQTPLREDWFFSVCAFHRQLLIRNACILHASYVDIGGEAILFTGPSGIGKSTQADLWTKYGPAQVINGDRALLRQFNGKWHVFGYPSSGTSGICINRSMPLKAIVVLKQAADNQVEPLRASEKIRALLAATELYPWDSSEIDMALHTAGEITAEIPVVRLSCRPDRNAVEVLKAYLEENT